MSGFSRYKGGGTTPQEQGVYRASSGLVVAVNTAIALHRPLLVTGEAGTGKTMLAYAVASELGLPIRRFQVRSDHRGREILYFFDDMARFFDANAKVEDAKDRANYLRFGALGEAFESEGESVVLIDEIDKAPRDFPNDLLDALDQMSFSIPSVKREVKARVPPIVIVTSNRESRLPDPFLRRCIFHFIEFPDTEDLVRLLASRLQSHSLSEDWIRLLVKRFVEIRDLSPRLQHRPATAELLTWAQILLLDGVGQDPLRGLLKDLPHLEAVTKTLDDHDRVKGIRRDTGAR